MVVIHPLYNKQLSSSTHDIALIRLAGKALNVPTVCLPVAGAPILSRECWAAGEYI